jgi:hypothetical protein
MRCASLAVSVLRTTKRRLWTISQSVHSPSFLLMMLFAYRRCSGRFCGASLHGGATYDFFKYSREPKHTTVVLLALTRDAVRKLDHAEVPSETR